MIEVRIRRDSRERLSSFLANGHAGKADWGEDVVCAAVATLLQAAWLGLSEVTGVTVLGERESGRLSLGWPEVARDDPAVRAIVETVARSIETIARDEPDHVRVIHERSDG